MYFLLLGAINLSRRPLLVSGGHDIAALALALSGLVIVGPMELFFPLEAAIHFGSYVWPLLLALYAMSVVLLLLLLRPRLVIYNITGDKLRPMLADLVNQLDTDARWAGDSLSLPGLGVQLYLDNSPALRCVSLISAGGNQSHSGWQRLETALDLALAREEVARNPRGVSLLSAGILIALIMILAISRNPQAVACSLLNVVEATLRMVGL